MGANNNYYRATGQQQNSSGLLVLPASEHDNNKTHKPATTKMEIKILLYLLNVGYGLYTFLNIENVKGWILFIIGVLYGGARVVFYIIKQNQDRRMRELDIQERQKKIARTRNTT